jgi:glycosyltransferase involved in cell wall biosynthesis
MISVVILTKNEEKVIGRCLESVKWCDEIIVIDDNSLDKTAEIARKFNAKVYSRSLNKDFSAQRNFGLSKAKEEWVFFVDSDEVVSDALVYEIQNAIRFKDQNLREFNGFYIKRSDFIWGKQLKYGETGNVKLLRLGKKGAGVWEGMIHERWAIRGTVGDLKNPILHFPHQNLGEFLNEINFYTDIKANELRNKNTKTFFLSILLYPLGKFFLNYFLKKGFMDGIQGLMVAIIMSFHSFLVRGKLWLKYNE